MNEYLEQLKNFIIEHTNGEEVTVKFKIYSHGNGDASIEISARNSLNEEQYLETPFEIIRGIVNHLVSESTEWNIFEYELSRDQSAKWSTYWDAEREAIEKAPVFDENAEAEFVDESIFADSDIEMDYTSTDSLRPWYFMKSTNTSMEVIVSTMVEQGSELDTEDLEDLDFSQEGWSRIFSRLVEVVDGSTEVKIRIDEEFNPETKAIQVVLFYISIDGEVEVIRLEEF